MSLQAQATYTVPEETARIAHAVFPKGNLYLQLVDIFGTLFADADFEELFPNDGQPALSPVRLSLVLILQFAEGLSDRQAADAVRSRIDWKYVLCLELDDPGFHYSVLSEFRTRLLENKAEHVLFEKLLARCMDKGLIKKRGKQRRDSTHVLGMIHTLNRVELVGETMRHALNTLAVAAPEWMLAHSQPDWIDRYGPQVRDYRLPDNETKRAEYVAQVGADGLYLLQAIWRSTDYAWLKNLPTVQTLREVWLQNYTWQAGGQLRWRTKNEVPPAMIAIRSPYDTEARLSKKRNTTWVGYKVHITETCDTDYPRLVTHIETTPAPTNDLMVTDAIHQALEGKDCLPEQHIVDGGYVDADRLVASREGYEVDLLGPTRCDTAWQTREGTGFTAYDFTIDWENQIAICPEGKTSLHWTPATNNKGKSIIQIKFSKRDCRACPSQPKCTRSNPPRRSIAILPQASYLALQAAREREPTEAFTEHYAVRAGIEGTISQGVRRCGLRRSRYVGFAKTHLQHVLTATAMNLVRVLHWLMGDQPTQTHPSAFVRLHATTAA